MGVAPSSCAMLKPSSSAGSESESSEQSLAVQAPVFRELYSEKRVVFEERRMRVDDSPMGKFQESFAAQAMANNYRRPVIGYPADLTMLGRREVQTFFNRHYAPQRLSIAVVGDVQVDQVGTIILA